MKKAQQVPDPRVADLVQAGNIRVGVHSVMYTKDPRTGELKAASVGIILLDIARTLGARIGAEILPVGHPTIPETLTCLRAGACDVGFMGPDPSRTGVDFSPPLLQVDYTFLVPGASSIQRIADVDRPGVRIAVVSDHASTLTLSRILKHAQLVYAATPDPTFELLRSGQADAFASVRGVLLEYSAKLPGSRVLDEHYGANLLFRRPQVPRVGTHLRSSRQGTGLMVAGPSDVLADPLPRLHVRAVVGTRNEFRCAGRMA
jgi:polar amino acid transport system substrate-binding protein